MAKVKIGNQNPTLSRIILFKKSKYKESIEIYEKSGNKAQEWQENLKTARQELGAYIMGGVMPIVSYNNAIFMNSEASGTRLDD